MSDGNRIAAGNGPCAFGVILVMIAALACPAHARAEEAALPPINSTGPCMGEEGFSQAWLDRAHNYITRSLCQPSVWFDNFFGEQRASEEWPGSLVRWRGDYRFDERDGKIYRSEFGASLRLPKASSRLKLVIASESRDSGSVTHPDDDPYDLDPTSTGTGETQTTAGFRLVFSESRRVRAQLGLGARLDTPIDPYVRIRLRLTEPLGTLSLVRITPAAIWYRDRGLDRSLHIDLERRVGENILLRASQSGVWKEQEPGILWGTEFSFLDHLSPKVVFNTRLGASGTSKPFVQTQRYRFSLRLRSNFFRPWLFMEAEPELYWPRDEEGRYEKYRALTFRIEVQFFS